MDNPEPEWNPITLPAEKLIDMSCNKKVFKVECWDWDKKEDKHKQIG